VVSVTQRLGSCVVAVFAVVFTRLPRLIRLLDPLTRRMLMTRLPAGPNVLLTVRGRTTGRPRTVPVAFLDLGERGLLQAASGAAGWVRNVRAAGEAVISRGGHSERFAVTELAPEAAGHLLHELLASFPRSGLIGAVVGPVDRPPLAVLHYFRLRVDDTLDDYVDLARRQPLFELRPVSRRGGVGTHREP